MTEEASKLKSDLILEDLKKQQLDREIVDVEERKVKLVIFKLVGAHYAFYGVDTKEILPCLKIYYVPASPEFILGIINVRGDIQSVLDVRILMGLTQNPVTNETRIIIAQKKDIRSGILVESVEDVLDVPESSIKEAISTLDDQVGYFVLGETEYKGHNVTLLDVGKLFEKLTSEE